MGQTNEFAASLLIARQAASPSESLSLLQNIYTHRAPISQFLKTKPIDKFLGLVEVEGVAANLSVGVTEGV